MKKIQLITAVNFKFTFTCHYKLDEFFNINT